MKIATTALLAAVVAAPALAQAPTQRQPDVVRASNGGAVWIWRDAAKMDEGFRLLDAGVNRTQPQLLMPLIACMVPSNTPVVVVSNAGWLSRNVLVVEGRDTGCRGVVPLDLVIRAR